MYLFAYCKRLFQSSDWNRWGEKLSTVGSGVSEVLIKYSDSKHCLFLFLHVFFILTLEVAGSAILHILNGYPVTKSYFLP